MSGNILRNFEKKMTATKIHDKWQNNHIHKFCHLTLVNMSSVSLTVFSFFRMRLKNMIVIYAFWTNAMDFPETVAGYFE